MRSSLGIARAAWLTPYLLLGAAGCSSDSSFKASPDIGGSYTVSVTDADNGCMIDSWVAGKSTSDIPFVIEQQSTNVTGSLQGLAGLALAVSIGTAMFQGTTTSDDFDMTAYGTTAHTQGSCMFKLNAEIKGSISGDLISGTITYAPATTNDPACASIQCTSTQTFNGTRPPS
jgi:hypothetical protein